MEKMEAVVHHIATINWQALLVGIICLAILILWPYINKTIPGSLIAVIVGIALVKLLNMNVNTIGDLYEISNKLPQLQVPEISFEVVREMLPDAFTIAILAAIESLLSCVVADSMINSKHRSNMELIAQALAISVPHYLVESPPQARLQGRLPTLKRRAHTGCRHGPCSDAGVDSGSADALCGADSDALYRRNFVYGCL